MVDNRMYLSDIFAGEHGKNEKSKRSKGSGSGSGMSCFS